MRTLLRALISLLFVLWLGGVMFFPVVAAVAFTRLPNTYMAGLVVRNSLLILNTEGLVAGALLLGLLLLAGWTRAYGRTVIGPVLCTVVMLALTAFTQWNVIPRMEADQRAVGGDISRTPPTEPHRAEFDRLHHASTWLEGGVLLAGIGAMVLSARAPVSRVGRLP